MQLANLFTSGCCCAAVFAGFLDRLRIELRLQGQLQALGLKAGTVQKLLETRLNDNTDGLQDLRLDLSPMRQVGLCFAVCRHASAMVH